METPGSTSHKKSDQSTLWSQNYKALFPQDLRKRLIESLVVPRLDYNSNVVYSDISKGLRGQLQRLTNTGIRYIFGRKRQEHITPFIGLCTWSNPHSSYHFLNLTKKKSPYVICEKIWKYRLSLMTGVYTLSKLSMLSFGTKSLHAYEIFLLIKDSRLALGNIYII